MGYGKKIFYPLSLISCPIPHNFMNSQINIFNKRAKRLHRDRASKLLEGNDFLFVEAAMRIAERFSEDIKREFPVALDLGCRTGQLSEMMKTRGGVETIFLADSSIKMLKKNRSRLMVACEDELLPFKPESFDTIVSALNLHWANDLPGALVQIRQCLKKDGMFIGSMLGGETLKELREAIKQAELEVSGGISPRISPFAETKDAGSLLQRAGFALPVADSVKLTVIYKDVYALMNDLRNMGETNALLQRERTFPPRRLMAEIDIKYAELFADENGELPATFEIITMTGWKN